MVNRSASIKSARSESEETAFSDTSDSTLQASSFVDSKKDEEMGKEDVLYDAPNKKQSPRPSWAHRAASSISGKIEAIKNKTSSAGRSVQETITRGVRQIGGGLSACVNGFNIVVLFVLQGCSAAIKYFFKGLWVVLCVWGRCYVEFFFAVLFALSAALLSLSIAVKAHAPIDPEDLKYATQSRLNLIMGFSIFMLVALTVCVLTFELCVRSYPDGCSVMFIELILGISWLFLGFAFGAGWSSSEEEHYPKGLRCTYGLSTPTPGLCDQVHTIRSLLLAELILIFVTFGAVGLSPMLAD